MGTEESLLSLIYIVDKKQKIDDETYPFYVLAKEEEIINARDILTREYGWIKIPKTLTPHNELYLMAGVLIDKPLFHNTASTLKDLEYGIKFMASEYEFPDNINVIAEELRLPIFEGRIE